MPKKKKKHMVDDNMTYQSTYCGRYNHFKLDKMSHEKLDELLADWWPEVTCNKCLQIRFKNLLDEAADVAIQSNRVNCHLTTKTERQNLRRLNFAFKQNARTHGDRKETG